MGDVLTQNDQIRYFNNIIVYPIENRAGDPCIRINGEEKKRNTEKVGGREVEKKNDIM